MSTNLLFFGIYPYVALLICLVGSWARFDLSQYTWKAGSSQMLSKKGMRVYSNLFHVGVLFILAGHFVGLLTPASVYHHLISTENKQLLAMVSGGFFGVLCFIGLSGLILRRLTDARVRATGNASDLMILLVLALAGGGAALYYFKFRKPKADTTGHDDLDEYDFGEDEDADEEPAEIEIHSEDGQEDET